MRSAVNKKYQLYANMIYSFIIYIYTGPYNREPEKKLGTQVRGNHYHVVFLCHYQNRIPTHLCISKQQLYLFST